MTSPGGEGSAFVEIQGVIDEEKLARHVQKVMKKHGEIAGDTFAKSMLKGFRRRLNADLVAYERAGARAGAAVRRGFGGERRGFLAAQDFLRGVRRGLAAADIRAGATTRISQVGEGAPTVDRDRQRILDTAHSAALREAASRERDRQRILDTAHSAALREAAGFERDLRRIRDTAHADALREAADRERGLQRIRDIAHSAALREAADRERSRQRILDFAHGEALKEAACRERDILRAREKENDNFFGRLRKKTQALSKDLGKFNPLKFLIGGASLFSQQGALQLGLKLSPTLIPGMANLFQALRNATGSLLGVFPAATAAAGAFALFSGKNTRLLAAVKPVSKALDAVRINLDGIAAAASQGAFSRFADRVVPDLKSGLEQFAGGFGTALSNILDSLGRADAGASLSRALTSIGQAFQTLTNGPGLTGFFRLLLRINEQVSATLPALFKRLQGFLNGLDTRFAKVNFGAVFERGVQAVVDFGGALVNLLRVLNAFFNAVTGPREQGTFFANLRANLASLVAFLQRPDVIAGIHGFFDAFRALGSLVIRSIGAALSGFFSVVSSGGPSMLGLRDRIVELTPTFVTFARSIGETIEQIVDVVSKVIAWADANGLLLPSLAALAVVIAGLAAASGIAVVAEGIAALLNPVGLTIVAIAALVGVIIYANSSSSALAGVLRTVLSAALRALLFPIEAVLVALRTLLNAMAETAHLANTLSPGNPFKNVELGAQGAANAVSVLEGRLLSLATIQGPGGDFREGTDPLTKAIQKAGADKAAKASASKAAADLDRLLAGLKVKFPSTGARDTSKKGGGAAKAAKQTVDLAALQETLTTRLQDSLRQGGKATQKTFEDLRKTIRSTLKGTAQEGRTGAALAALEKMRSDAVAAARSYEQISNAVDKTRDRLKALKDEQNSFRQSVLDTLKSAASIQTFLSARPGAGVASFGRFLGKQADRLQKFQDSLRTLLQRGLDPALVRDLASGGLDNQKFAAKLAAAAPEQLALINKLQAQINALAKGTANLTAATFDAGIKRVESLLSLQLTQQKKQEAQLDRLARGIVAGISAAIKGKPIPKFAHGGVATGPSIFGEAGPELAVPLRASQRSREVEQLLGALAAQNGSTDKSVRIENQNFILPATKASPYAIARAVDRHLAGQVR